MRPVTRRVFLAALAALVAAPAAFAAAKHAFPSPQLFPAAALYPR